MLMMLVMTLCFVIAAIAIDVGFWLSERRGMAKAADLAALAGTLSLPHDPDQAEADALEWAGRNGYADGADGVEVSVDLLCSNSIGNPPAGICANTNAPGSSACAARVGCDSMQVTIRQPGKHLFTSLFGLSGVQIGFGAVASVDFEVKPLDAVLLLDATGSMGAPPCNAAQSNNGCPIKEAKAAAISFTDILLDAQSGLTQVGFAPYRGCSNPPRQHGGCVPAANVTDLTSNRNAVRGRITSTVAQGGTGTNVCLGLLGAQGMFNGPAAQGGPDVQKFAIILTDGDNTYNSASFGEGHPPTACRPTTSPQSSDPNITSDCTSAQPRERELDTRTKARADDLKVAGAEIFVIGFGVCGTPSNNTPTLSYCNGIGNSSSDNVADRRLLRCIASSTTGTNDHYFEVPRAEDLPQVFQVIAWKIAGRALTQ